MSWVLSEMYKPGAVRPSPGCFSAAASPHTPNQHTRTHTMHPGDVIHVYHCTPTPAPELMPGVGLMDGVVTFNSSPEGVQDLVRVWNGDRRGGGGGVRVYWLMLARVVWQRVCVCRVYVCKE